MLSHIPYCLRVCICVCLFVWVFVCVFYVPGIAF